MLEWDDAPAAFEEVAVAPTTPERPTNDGQDAAADGCSSSILTEVFDELIDPMMVLGAMRDGVGAIVDFRFVAANRSAFEFMRLPSDELIGARLLELFPGLAPTGLFERYARVVETGEPLVLDDHPYLSELLGEERLFDIRAVRAGENLVFTWRDVTDRLERDRARARVLSMEALADERDRVARDLHDGAIQEVYGTALSLRAVAGQAPERIRRQLAPIIDAQDMIIRHLRATVLGLTRPDLSEMSVTALITRTVTEAERSLGFVPDLRLQGHLDELDDPLLIEHLLLSLREMLSNVARHAEANSVEVSVVASSSAVEVAVTDDGVGLDDATTKGYGLTNLAKRAGLLGGVFSMTGRVDGGACARWRVPRSPLGRLVAAS